MAGRDGNHGGPRDLALYAPLFALAGGNGLTRDELRVGVEAVTGAVNTLLEDSGDAHEAIADLVFAASFGKDVKAALAPSRRAPPVYRELKKRAGASLGIDADDLSLYLRIGALNEGGHGDAWNRLLWSKKEALLPLVKLDNAAVFRHGVAFANRPNVGVRHLRKWVRDEVAKAQGKPATETTEEEFTFSAGKKIVATAVPLRSSRARKAFAKKVNAAPPAERRRFKRDLEAAAENLRKLAAEIDDEDAGE